MSSALPLAWLKDTVYTWALAAGAAGLPKGSFQPASFAVGTSTAHSTSTPLSMPHTGPSAPRFLPASTGLSPANAPMML